MSLCPSRTHARMAPRSSEGTRVCICRAAAAAAAHRHNTMTLRAWTVLASRHHPRPLRTKITAQRTVCSAAQGIDMRTLPKYEMPESDSVFADGAGDVGVWAESMQSNRRQRRSHLSQLRHPLTAGLLSAQELSSIPILRILQEAAVPKRKVMKHFCSLSIPRRQEAVALLVNGSGLAVKV